ncbi:NAD(P)H-binding family protein [Rhizoctonia solani 123E]|uniref:NAD(P)H-binding family protein n=1 Tax=Rhizoctonia solani 123E TaxID=1423351 RepID=A0A074SIM5_9AGAM|nr:NAD(P)H-binding family protein [Rhizoctonia solani 123E]
MKVILVAGATGQQGGSVIRALSDSEDYLCLALTRNPESPKAQKLQTLKNVKLVSGDLNDIQQLRKVFEDAKSTPTNAIWGVFVALEYPGLGANAEGEERQGKNIATVAQEFQVQSYIYTTSCMLPFPDDKPPIPKTTRHSKISIEKHVASLDMPWTILRPGFFMENFNTSVSGRFTGAAVQNCMSPNVKLQLLTVEDVGRFSRMIFDDPSKLNHKIIDLATPGLDAQERSQTFLETAGYDIPSIPSVIIHTVYWLNRHVQNMVGDFVQSDDMRKSDPKGYDANIQEAASHMKLVGFEEWARKLNQGVDRETNEHGVTIWGLLSKRT